MGKATLERLTWPKRPRRGVHDMLGRSQAWTSQCGQFRVERFLDASGKYLALAREERMGGIWTLLGRHKTLGAAQRTCEKRARGTR